MSTQSSPCPKALGRAFHNLYIQQLQRRGAMQSIANDMDMDKTKASRIKNEDMPDLFEMIARAGMKVVLADDKTYPQHAVNAMFLMLKENIQGASSVDDFITPR